MKIYERVVWDSNGKIIDEISYEYFGEVSLCKFGAGKAQREADRAYQLQLEQLELQKQQLKELEEKEKTKKFTEQQLLETKVKRRKGTASTILTDIGDFGTMETSKKSLYA